MKYCPKCRYGYKDNVNICPKCKEKLVKHESLKPFCKVCKKEFDNNIKFCPDCLVEISQPFIKKSSVGDVKYVNMVTVYETSDIAELALIKGLLEGANIKYYARGENVQSLFALGLTSGINPLTGPIKIDVEKDKTEEALNLIKNMLDR